MPLPDLASLEDMAADDTARKRTLSDSVGSDITAVVDLELARRPTQQTRSSNHSPQLLDTEEEEEEEAAAATDGMLAHQAQQVPI